MSEANHDTQRPAQEPRRSPRRTRTADEEPREREPARSRPSNRPVRTIRIGRIRAAIWANQVEDGVVYNTTFERLYKPDGEDQWKSSDSSGTNDLLLLAKVADLAHSWIHQHKGPLDSY